MRVTVRTGNRPKLASAAAPPLSFLTSTTMKSASVKMSDLFPEIARTLPTAAGSVGFH